MKAPHEWRVYWRGLVPDRKEPVALTTRDISGNQSATEQGPPQQPKPLGDHIDVYECPVCHSRVLAPADHLTFSKPPPLECDNCGAWDMLARRYVAHG
jgi:hypothetical protein